jgi:hypothetical protein
MSEIIFLNYVCECDFFVMNILWMVRGGSPKEYIPSSSGLKRELKSVFKGVLLVDLLAHLREFSSKKSLTSLATGSSSSMLSREDSTLRNAAPPSKD